MIYMRADANPIIASGHVMRCLAIADAAREMGETTTFIIADPAAIELIESRGYGHILLNSQWDLMDSEIEELSHIITGHGIKVLLVDSYSATEKYLSSINQMVPVYYIDDLNAYKYPVSGIICYSGCWERFDHKSRYSDSDTKLLLGPKYIPLRKEFGTVKEKCFSQDNKNSLLIMSGGNDEHNVIGRVLSSLDAAKFSRIDAVCGIYNSNFEEIKNTFEKNKNIFIHSNIRDIHKYMEEADIAVSAGGTTLFELCACGTLTVTYSLAENQIENAQILHEKGIVRYAGDVSDNSIIDRIADDLSFFNDLSIEEKRNQSNKMRVFVDGKGAKRVAEALVEEERNSRRV